MNNICFDYFQETNIDHKPFRHLKMIPLVKMFNKNVL